MWWYFVYFCQFKKAIFSAHHLELRLNYTHQNTHCGIVYTRAYQTSQCHWIIHWNSVTESVFDSHIFDSWIWCFQLLFFGNSPLSVSVKIILNDETLFRFHSHFMASNSIRHGHLCLCFMVFRTGFLRVLNRTKAEKKIALCFHNILPSVHAFQRNRIK